MKEFLKLQKVSKVNGRNVQYKILTLGKTKHLFTSTVGRSNGRTSFFIIFQ